MKNGLVISDLHLFSRRSQGEACIAELNEELADIDVLVLNGDTFDFRWSEKGNEETSIQHAVTWVENLAARFHGSDLHYVIGNHDCLSAFCQKLQAIENREDHFHLHEQVCRLGSSIFLHGDCSNWGMSAARLQRYREAWAQDSQKGAFAKTLYSGVDVSGLGQLFHRLYFQEHPTVNRVERNLLETLTNGLHGLSDCFFGHTHVPFTNHVRGPLTYHNTGSAIQGMGFQPLRFEIP